MNKISKKLKKQGPITTILILTIIIGIVSFVLKLFKFSGYTTEAGTLETSLIGVNNIFSKEGIKYFLTNSVINMQLMQPLIYLIMSLIAVSIMESSGLLNHLVFPLKKFKSVFITALVMLLSIFLSFLGDYTYILLIPLVCAAYKYLGKNPLLGIITVFIGVTIGYGSGFIFGYQNYLLSNITMTSATNIDSEYVYNLSSNLLIMIISSIILTIVGTISIEKFLSKHFSRYDNKAKLNRSRKALFISLSLLLIIFLWGVYSIIPGLPFSGMLLNSNEKVYIAKIFGDSSALGNGFMLLTTGSLMLCSFIYGRISGNIRNSNDYTHALTHSFENTGYILVLMFFASIMIGLFEWSNIPTVITTNIVDFVGSLNFSGSLLVGIVFVAILIISILIPSSIIKWNLVAPVFVPLLMRANITPSFSQSIFMMSDSVGKLFSPIYLYLIIMIGFLYKQDQKVSTSIFDTMKLLFPVIIILAITNLLIIVGWYLIGLPIGIGTSVTM